MASAKNEKAHGKHRLFEDISVVQVTATALAAVTSMLLSSYIGIAGSVIGVAIASIVSTLAASLYKHFLKESAEKIKEIPVVGKTHEIIEHASAVINGETEKHSGESSNSADTEGSKGATSDNKEPISLDKEAGKADDSEPDEKTIPLDELKVQGAAITIPLSDIEEEQSASGSDDADESDSTESRSDQTHYKPGQDDDKKIQDVIRAKRRMKIGLIVVCVVSALIAVALSAVIIYVSSEGQGIGTKPQQLFTSSAATEVSDDASETKFTTSTDESGSSISSSSSSTSSSSSAADSSSSSSSSSSSDATEGNLGTDDSSSSSSASSSAGEASSSSGNDADQAGSQT